MCIRDSTSEVQRSACSGVHTDGVVQPSVPFTNRKVCSMSNLRREARQHRSRSGSPVPDHHSHKVFLIRPVGLGRCSTSTLITLPLMIGGSSQSLHLPRPCSFGCRSCQAVTVTFP